MGVLVRELFSLGNLDRAQQQLVIDRLPQYRPALSRNRNANIDADIWRACYNKRGKVADATALLGMDSVRPEDIDWVINTLTERRPAAINAILRRWTLPAGTCAALLSRLGDESLRQELLSARTTAQPQVQLIAAGHGNLSEVAAVITDSGPCLSDAEILTAALSAVAGTGRGEGEHRLSAARIAHQRPGLRSDFAHSGIDVLVAGAAQTSLDSAAQQAAAVTLLNSLGTDEHSHAAAGLIGLLDRYDTGAAVRARIWQALANNPSMLDKLHRCQTPGLRTAFPTSTAAADLTEGQIDMLMLRIYAHDHSIPAGVLALLDLAQVNRLTDDQTRRLIAILSGIGGYQYSTLLDAVIEDLCNRIGRPVPESVVQHLTENRARHQRAAAITAIGDQPKRRPPAPVKDKYVSDFARHIRASAPDVISGWLVNADGVHSSEAVSKGSAHISADDRAAIHETAVAWLLERVEDVDVIVALDQLTDTGLCTTLGQLLDTANALRLTAPRA